MYITCELSYGDLATDDPLTYVVFYLPAKTEEFVPILPLDVPASLILPSSLPLSPFPLSLSPALFPSCHFLDPLTLPVSLRSRCMERGGWEEEFLFPLPSLRPLLHLCSKNSLPPPSGPLPFIHLPRCCTGYLLSPFYFLLPCPSFLSSLPTYFLPCLHIIFSPALLLFFHFLFFIHLLGNRKNVG